MEINKQCIFTDDELRFINGRIEVELGWGQGIYEQKDVKLMQNIMSKIEKQLNNYGNK